MAQEVDGACGVHADREELEDDPAEHEVPAKINGRGLLRGRGEAPAEALHNQRYYVLWECERCETEEDARRLTHMRKMIV